MDNTSPILHQSSPPVSETNPKRSFLQKLSDNPILTVIIIICILIIVKATINNSNSVTNWKEYTDTDLHYKVSYPANWNLFAHATGNLPSKATIITDADHIGTDLYPLENANSIDIYLEDTDKSPNETLLDYIKRKYANDMHEAKETNINSIPVVQLPQDDYDKEHGIVMYDVTNGSWVYNVTTYSQNPAESAILDKIFASFSFTSKISDALQWKPYVNKDYSYKFNYVARDLDTENTNAYEFASVTGCFSAYVIRPGNFVDLNSVKINSADEVNVLLKNIDQLRQLPIAEKKTFSAKNISAITGLPKTTTEDTYFITRLPNKQISDTAWNAFQVIKSYTTTNNYFITTKDNLNYVIEVNSSRVCVNDQQTGMLNSFTFLK